MKVLYFNIHNGICVPAYTALPAFRATITGSKIHTVETSFNVSNIIRHGYDWFINQVEEENRSWTMEHPHLMKSLKKLALKQSLKHPFRYSNFDQLNHRFPFVVVWQRGMKFNKAHFDNYVKNGTVTLKGKAKKKPECPNCKEEMDEKDTPEGIMILCGICSYGWYSDLKENSYKRDKDPFIISMREIFKEFGIRHKF